MIVLDENILDGQRLLLEAWRLAPRQIGVSFGRKGLKDEEILVFLRQQRNLTFSRAMLISITLILDIEATAWLR